MKDIYKYMYYRLYSWNLKKWGENDAPEWNALFGVSFVMTVNVALLLLVLEYIGILHLMLGAENKNVRGFVAIVTLLTSGMINYFRFIKNKRYRNINKEFIHESKQIQLRNALLLWIYVILSFLSGFILIDIMR